MKKLISHSRKSLNIQMNQNMFKMMINELTVNAEDN